MKNSLKGGADWKILKYQPIIMDINNEHKRTTVVSVSILYNNTPDDKLFQIMRELIGFCFMFQKKEKKEIM